MTEARGTLGPLVLFMLSPLLIPIVTITVGAAYDVLTRGNAPKGWQRERPGNSPNP